VDNYLRWQDLLCPPSPSPDDSLQTAFLCTFILHLRQACWNLHRALSQQSPRSYFPQISEPRSLGPLELEPARFEDLDIVPVGTHWNEEMRGECVWVSELESDTVSNSRPDSLVIKPVCYSLIGLACP
jgi:hypothetical protein